MNTLASLLTSLSIIVLAITVMVLTWHMKQMRRQIVVLEQLAVFELERGFKKH